MRAQDRPILLVEDDKIDAMTVRRALKELRVRNPLTVVNNGEEALKYLSKPESIKPCIILLDLNMPKMNGIEFLKTLKKDAEMKRIPVLVLTTSMEEDDKLSTFDLGIAGYMIKPVDYHDFVEIVRTIDLYWTLSEFPE